MVASRATDVLDGRAPSAIPTSSEYWRTFRNRRWPLRDGLFNTMVPGTVAGYGSWDWDDDGLLDTLWFDSCGGPRNMSDLGLPPVGCVTTFADTLPGKQNNRYGSRGGVIGIGPFALAAGDTVGFSFAFLAEPDSLSFEATLSGVIDAYLSFFLTPVAPPAAAVTSSDVLVNARLNTRRVTITYADAPETWTDPYLSKVAADIQNAPAGRLANYRGVVFDLERLRRLNPSLVAQITARAADNLAAIEIYKSCDGGATYTSDADCDGDVARDNGGRPVGTGWQAYATLTRPPGGGDIPNVFTDQAVEPGRSYRYAVVTRSRGAAFGVLDSLPGQGFVARRLVLADSLVAPLPVAPEDPRAVSVYVPASVSAATAAQLDSVGVVPNPYIGYSRFQPDVNTPRILFTHLPPQGVIRIYTVAGQFQQEIRWREGELSGTGDLAYDLSTAQGSTLGSGLYIWVLTATVEGRQSRARGKFVVVRGRGT
jgi:hypothetical protein